MRIVAEAVRPVIGVLCHQAVRASSNASYAVTTGQLSHHSHTYYGMHHQITDFGTRGGVAGPPSIGWKCRAIDAIAENGSAEVPWIRREPNLWQDKPLQAAGDRDILTGVSPSTL